MRDKKEWCVFSHRVKVFSLHLRLVYAKTVRKDTRRRVSESRTLRKKGGQPVLTGIFTLVGALSSASRKKMVKMTSSIRKRPQKGYNSFSASIQKKDVVHRKNKSRNRWREVLEHSTAFTTLQMTLHRFSGKKTHRKLKNSLYFCSCQKSAFCREPENRHAEYWKPMNVIDKENIVWHHHHTGLLCGKSTYLFKWLWVEMHGRVNLELQFLWR